MWEDWSKTIGNDYRVYSFVFESCIPFLLETHIVKSISVEATSWKVSLFTFHPLSGAEVIYEEMFPDFSEAETMAWKRSVEEAKNAYDNL